MEQTIFSTPKNRFYFRVLITLLILLTVIVNLSTLTKLVGDFGGMQDALVRAERDVYQAFYHEPPDARSLYERHRELETRAVLVDWYELPDNWLKQTAGRIEREGTIYGYTRTADSDRLRQLGEAGFEVRLWKRYDLLDGRPLIFKLMKLASRFKNSIRASKKENVILVYQIKSQGRA